MRTKLAIITAVVALGGAGYAVAQDDDTEPCVKQAGNSSLRVSAEKVELLRQHGWKATDETGRLVCD